MKGHLANQIRQSKAIVGDNAVAALLAANGLFWLGVISCYGSWCQLFPDSVLSLSRLPHKIQSRPVLP